MAAVLGLNLFFQSREYEPSTYDVEERVYEYVERNTYYLIMAITIFLLVSASQSGIKLGNANFATIIYSQAVAVSLCVFVLALLWMPTRDVTGIVHLRHCKTVLFTFALGSFLIGPLEVLLSR